VIGSRIIEVYGALDEPQAEYAGVEIEISLRVAGDAGDVMNAVGPEGHRPDSVKNSERAESCSRGLASFRGLALSTLFLRSSAWHDFFNLFPSIQATDMPLAEASM
jgi:hypothetical protein